MNPQLTKEQWIEEVYQLLCKSNGPPASTTQEKNLREYAVAMASEEAAYFQEGMTPLEAHYEETLCGS